jgi:hypothetical protein
MRPAFEQMNSVGREAEERVANVFLKAGWFVQWRFMAHRHDLSVIAPGGVVEMLEVKNEDNYADGTNACFEVVQNGNEFSGLYKSESTVCIHTFGADCLTYRTQPMRNWVGEKIRRHEYAMKNFGDNGNRGIVVPRITLGLLPFAQMTTLPALPCSKVFKR